MNITKTCVTTDDLRKFCVDANIVSKSNKLNPRKDKSGSDCAYIEQSLQAPIKVAIDIIFERDGNKPLCSFCGSELNFYDLPNYKPINYTHKHCVKKSKQEKIDWQAATKKRKSTCLEKYGTEYYFDYDRQVSRARKTKLDRYGDANYVNSKKAKKTKLDRYGDENYRNAEKISETNQERYGATNPFGSRQIIDKITEKLERQHGGRGFASGTIREEIRKTNLEVFGTENAMQNAAVSGRSNDTKRKRYYGPDLYDVMTSGLEQQYDAYVNDNQLSIRKISDAIGVDRNTLSRAFQRDGFEILDRNYGCSTSAGEQYLAALIRDIDQNAEIITNTRSIIHPKEIDIWLPRYNIGIEHHGSYWHQEEKAGNKHRDKAIAARELGIRLIQIFDYEIVEHEEKIVALLESALGIYSDKLYARNCSVVELETVDAKKFCEQYHIQDYSPAKVNYGLMHDDHGLVQLMSFGNPRFSKKYQWEIIRMCSKRGHMILGGTEKLWSHFIKQHNPHSVISYADARFFSGKSYEKINFEYHRHSDSGYFWSNGVTKLSRHQTRKDKLVSENKNYINNTEKQIMASKGFHKILDAGNLVYTWRPKL